MGTTVESRITSTEAKEAIYNAHNGGNVTTQQKADLDKIEEIESSASGIDNNIFNSIQGLRKIRDASTSLNFSGKVVSFLGDSLGQGQGATDLNGFMQRAKKCLDKEYGSSNFGFTYGAMGFQSGNTFIINDNATDSMGGLVAEVLAGNTLTCGVNATFAPAGFPYTKVRALASLSDVGKSITIRSRNFSGTVIGATIDTTIGSDGLSVDTLDNNSSGYNIDIINNSGTTMRIEGIVAKTDDSKYTTNIFTKGGRKLAGIEDNVLDRWFANSEYAIFALGTNDTDYTAFKNRIDYITNMYQSSNYTKLIVMDLDIQKAKTDEFRVAIKGMADACKGSVYINMQELITANNSTADYNYLANPLHLLDPDLIHFSDSGHDFLANVLLKAMGANINTHIVDLL